MPIYGLPRVISELKKRFEYVFATENRYPGAPSVDIHLVENKSFTFKDKKITPIKVWHGDLPILGYRIDNLAYITDAKIIEPQELEKLYGLDVLVLNCLRKDIHYSHLNLQEALKIIDIVKPKRTYFTHISQTFGFHDEISKELPENVFLAYDNLTVTV